MNEILITLPDEETMIAFATWFDKEGFDLFLKTKQVEHSVSCLSMSEYPKQVGEDFYTELSPQCQFELE